jgi:hypothetical protein
MTTPAPDDGDWIAIEVRANDGTVLRNLREPLDPPMHVPTFAEIHRRIDMSAAESSMARMQEAFARMAEMLEALPRFEVPRGGISYEPGWIPPSFRKRDPRKGDDIEVRVLVPGDKVFILEGVFTVHRVDMKAPIPTVWLEELPDSPLYFTDTDYIPLANETED